MRSLGGLVYAEYIMLGTPQRRARKTSYVLRLVLFLGCTLSFQAGEQFLQKVFNLKLGREQLTPACHLPLKNPNLTTQPTF